MDGVEYLDIEGGGEFADAGGEGGVHQVVGIAIGAIAQESVILSGLIACIGAVSCGIVAIGFIGKS
jgi:hypothetical protein